ncbi:MAG: signal peptide peptidase SppA [Alphaproteobacteria bacterium]|nr:signal peptide peptidase SppA [Alphaproteobacteria bacterium]
MKEKIVKLIHSFCTITGALFLLIIIGITALSIYSGSGKYIEPHSLLVINFEDKFSETSDVSLLDEFNGVNKLNFLKLLQSIEYASVDKNIDGIIARIEVTDLDMAQVQELAQAIARFKQSGKKTYVFSKGFGPFGQGNREYYLASFFDKIYMQPHTYIGLTGIDIEIPFGRKVLDKIGVNPEFYARYEYKNAMASFTDEKISAPYKENMKSLAQNIMRTMGTDITNNRHLKTDFDKIINQAPLTAEQGKELDLVDDLMYLSEVEKFLKDEGIQSFVNITDYASLIHSNTGSLPQIAVLTLNGVINDGKSFTDLNGEYVIGSDNVISDLEDIKNLRHLKALIVRINSPGGSYNAADEIYFALKQLKKEKKIPIIVSQGGYAASGGYFLSLAGDRIVTEPLTITGSIGVLGGKFVLKGLWDKLGINWENVKIGNNADILSINKPFSESEKQIFNTSLDEVYDDFKAKVIENRKLNEDIKKIARGRVWTGKQAVKLGLADSFGGYVEAFKYALNESGIKADEKYKIAVYPQEKSFREKLYELLLTSNVSVNKIIANNGVDIRYLNLFKRLQYDTVLLPFYVNM